MKNLPQIDKVYAHGHYFNKGKAYRVDEAIEKFGKEAERIIIKDSWLYILNKRNENKDI